MLFAIVVEQFEADGSVSNKQSVRVFVTNQKAGFIDKREKRVSSEKAG